MNTASIPPVPDAAPARLPELSDVRIDAMEDALFADIARERGRSATRRRRVWLGAGAAAAVIVVAAVIAPTVVGLVSPSSSTSSTIASAPVPLSDSAAQSEIAKDAAGVAGSSALPGANTAVDPQVITTASATIAVEDVATGAQRVGAAATALGGSVESTTIGQSGVVFPMGGAADSIPVAPSPDGGWVTVRVPSDQLSALIAQLPGIGEVTASSITRQDVTDQTIDLQARIDASQVSIDRLTQLMAQATSTADLIAAESALAERQATLESYQQQLSYLSGQVEMSTLTVNLTAKNTAVTADPAGFGDGVAAGWNGLVATLNGIVIAVGFLIPWIAVIAVIAAVVWAIVSIVRRVRSRRNTRPSAEEPARGQPGD
ncbi:DUF4349 domain-containing protein [Microbacterium rhizomatis]|uniref:DUF4349 domain-containing protein n=1 Tax=Microbacterium rhizomatis TaxID=1631477 RepID=A0A5J5J7P1_9MICO|nr:DUF4349 domain-containing protein [Microbacterium rhizomatis]KAA9110803.1 DUF4349 domain-containing protein [Microbacterium rhizomatis]